ncbi:mavicyanin-like [Punica granatum]|uniref:Mavicyanin-like n=1 Tax=Punica granatum TaxID=22663 RepID=A0A6P8D278_PUNGR|nr:mavicyanin-like [Punica granatum]
MAGKHINVAVFMVAMLAALLQCGVAQTVHVVGDDLGWVIPQGGASAYDAWAASKKFVIGDTLVFNFATNQHDVLEVPRASFDSCSSANPIGSVITTGPANITLSAAGEHYYICTFSQHCSLGQKLSITVSSPGASPSPRTAPAPIPPPTNDTILQHALLFRLLLHRGLEFLLLLLVLLRMPSQLVFCFP